MKRVFVICAVMSMLGLACFAQEFVDRKGNAFDTYCIWVSSFGATQPRTAVNSGPYFTYTATCPIVSLEFTTAIGVINDFDITPDKDGSTIFIDSATSNIVGYYGMGQAFIEAGDTWSPKGKLAGNCKIYAKRMYGLVGHTTVYIKLTGEKKK